MASLWPWITLAGLGALHGLSPANGWMLAAAMGLRAHDAAQARRALLPIAIGHLASIALVAGAFMLGAQGLSMDRGHAQLASGLLLMVAATWRLLRGGRPCVSINNKASHAGIALWSLLMGSVHGAGLMLLPALMPLCLADNPAREITASGSWGLALAAIGVHTAAMLATTGTVATGVCRALARPSRVSSEALRRQVEAAVLAFTGAWMVALA